jgi:rfaE bifunctional protein kinase chain/domain
VTQPDAVTRRLIDRFSKVRVVVVGDLVADHYLYGQTERVSREAPVLVVRHEREEVKPGGAANVAANVRSLGGKVFAIGAIGSDPMGVRLKAQLAAAGIATPRGRLGPVVTETRTRVLAGGLSTTRQQMLRIDRGVRELSPRVRQRLAQAAGDALRHCEVAVLSDYGAGVACDETRAVLRDFVRRGGRLCADSRYALSSLHGATVVKPNEPELAAFTGMPVSGEQNLERAARHGLGMLGCEVLLVTRGRLGMAVFARGERSVFLPVHGSDEAVDVTGAGDTVLAAFALAFGAGASPAEAARLANVAGGLVVQKPGTATVSRAELLAES